MYFNYKITDEKRIAIVLFSINLARNFLVQIFEYLYEPLRVICKEIIQTVRSRMINWKRISSLLQHFPILSYIRDELARKDMHCTRSGAWHLGATTAQFLLTHARTHAHTHTHTYLKLSVLN